MALGWIEDAVYEARTAALTPGSTLMLYTDGLPDGIPGDDPDARLRSALAAGAAGAMARVTSLIDSGVSEDDVTVLLVVRRGG